MGKIKTPDKVKLIIGILFPGQEDTGTVETDLVDLYGIIDLKSEVIPFISSRLIGHCQNPVTVSAIGY